MISTLYLQYRNENRLKRYPIKDNCSMLSNEGIALDNSILLDAFIYLFGGTAAPYISSITSGVVTIKNDITTVTGTYVEDTELIELYDEYNRAAGFLNVSDTENLLLTLDITFENTAAIFLDTCYILIPEVFVSGITINDELVTGNIYFEGTDGILVHGYKDIATLKNVLTFHAVGKEPEETDCNIFPPIDRICVEYADPKEGGNGVLGDRWKALVYTGTVVNSATAKITFADSLYSYDTNNFLCYNGTLYKIAHAESRTIAIVGDIVVPIDTVVNIYKVYPTRLEAYNLSVLTGKTASASVNNIISISQDDVSDGFILANTGNLTGHKIFKPGVAEPYTIISSEYITATGILNIETNTSWAEATDFNIKDNIIHLDHGAKLVDICNRDPYISPIDTIEPIDLECKKDGGNILITPCTGKDPGTICDITLDDLDIEPADSFCVYPINNTIYLLPYSDPLSPSSAIAIKTVGESELQVNLRGTIR